jgi:hypothetical protein
MTDRESNRIKIEALEELRVALSKDINALTIDVINKQIKKYEGENI